MELLQIIRSIAIFLLILTGLAYGDQDSIDIIVQKIVHGGGGVNIAELSSEQRSELIPALKQAAQTGISYDPSYISNALIALNDDETISNFVNQYHSGDNAAGENGIKISES